MQKKTVDREILITFWQWELKKPQVFEQQSYIPVSIPASEQLKLNRWKLTVVVSNVNAYPFCGSHTPDLSPSWYRNRCFLVGLSRLIIQDTELGSSNQEGFSSTVKSIRVVLELFLVIVFLGIVVVSSGVEFQVCLIYLASNSPVTLYEEIWKTQLILVIQLYSFNSKEFCYSYGLNFTW